LHIIFNCTIVVICSQKPVFLILVRDCFYFYYREQSFFDKFAGYFDDNSAIKSFYSG